MTDPWRRIVTAPGRGPRIAVLGILVLATLVAVASPGRTGHAVPGAAAAPPDEGIVVASKKFTESVVLGEIAAQLLRQAGIEARHRGELGGSRILWNALLRGEVDVYPEYTGTLRQELLAGRDVPAGRSLDAVLAGLGVAVVGPLGFDNTYALGMLQKRAASLEIDEISDLVRHPDLRFGFTNEFLDRGDGWPGLRDRYGLPQDDVRGLDHDLAYRGLVAGDFEVTDLYSTDAEIRYYDLRVLEDDRDYFPDYEAIYLYRTALESTAPEVVARLRALEGGIDGDEMVAMNARVKLDGEDEARVAADFLARELGLAESVARETTVLGRLWRHTLDHLRLVGISLAGAILLALPLGIVAARRPRFGQAILGAVGIVQTIPSLALLVFMIPLLGIGGPPAIAALFLYSLLPIVRNTHAGLQGIPPEIRESARALGLPPRARLLRVELPMASPSILAGIKISAVINVGTATLGALIGAGGYGQPILTGIRLDDVGLILQGAVPAAVLALLAQGLFEAVERLVVPRGLRLADPE